MSLWANSMKTRKNQSAFNDDKWDSLIDAMNYLKRRKDYDRLAGYYRRHIHGGTAHNFRYFLPWHRQYLWIFEQSLRKIDSNVALPYWEWTNDRNVPIRLKRRKLDQKLWKIDRDREQVPNLKIQVSKAKRATSYTEFVQQIYDLYDYIHIEIGGTMETKSSPDDPLFWLHNCFIDKLWADWQADDDNDYFMRKYLNKKNVLNKTLKFPRINQRVPVRSVLNIEHMGYRYR